LNWILDRLIDFGFENVKIELIYWVQQHESWIQSDKVNWFTNWGLNFAQVPNGGESHVAIVDLAPNLHHFLTLPEVPSKSYYRVLNEEPLIDYNKK
jgi:hypothetical protein